MGRIEGGCLYGWWDGPLVDVAAVDQIRTIDTIVTIRRFVR
jgi:hypothetical protein